MRAFQIFLDWSEVWAMLIPLIIIMIYKPKEKSIRPLVWYLIIGLIFTLAATFMLEFYYLVPTSMYVKGMVNNNVFYNAHSITRVLFFSWYIISLRQNRFSVIIKILLSAYLVFVLANFILIESPFFLSTRLFAAESIVLLIVCLTYFFNSIQDESKTNWLKHPSFLICAGISFYEVITFFIFLFFYPLSLKDQGFFVITMRIFNIAFVILCIILSIAFYRMSKKPVAAT